MNDLSTTVKMLRKQYNLTQEELSLKSGVGLRFVRDLSLIHILRMRQGLWYPITVEFCLRNRLPK